MVRKALAGACDTGVLQLLFAFAKGLIARVFASACRAF